MTPPSTTTASPTTVALAGVLQESGVARRAPALQHAGGREHHRRRADRGHRPARGMQAADDLGDARILLQVVGARHAARQRDHVEVLLGERAERRVGREPDAVRSGDRAVRERCHDDVDAGAPQDVDDGHGLEFLEALGERHQHALHSADTSCVLPVLRKSTAARISGSRSPASPRRPRRLRLRQRHVGLDAALVDRHAGRREVARGRELQRLPVLERQHGLHRALAESLLAEKLRAPVVAQRPGDDLGRGRRAFVHQHRDRRAAREVALHRFHAEARFRRAPFRRHDRAVLQEGVRHLDRRVEHAARVVAKVEHEAAQLAARLAARARGARPACPARSSR